MTSEGHKKCPSCQSEMLGSFCHNCGEKALSSKDLSIIQLISDAWTSLTEVDGKWLKSFRNLLWNPGQLTIDYLSGVRKNRLTPFQLLLFSNILFFIVVGIVGYSAFTTHLEVHIQSTNFLHQSLAQQLVEQKILYSGQTFDEFSKLFNQRTEIQAKSLVIIMVPMLVILVALLNIKSQFSLITHWVFATHVFAFMLIIQSLITPITEQIVLKLLPLFFTQFTGDWFEIFYSLFLFGLFGLYYYLAASRVYKQSLMGKLISSFFFILGVYWIFLIYRMILFFTTFYTL